jgi:3-oxoacyl-[acyl-carrier-protein] synthase II
VKVTFVYPRFEKFLDGIPELNGELADYFLGDFTTPPSLGIPTLAAHTPPQVAIELLDDNAGDPIDYEAPTDLVAINCFTPQATRAFEIADEFRRHGKKTIMGGLFPTFMADECLRHADAVNIGEGEPTWPEILRDAEAGTLQQRYQGGSKTDLSTSPIPRRDVFYNKDSYDWDEDLVQVTRGCIYTCGMCSLPAQMGGRIRFRPVERVVEELQSLRYENVYLADDTLFFEQHRLREYAIRLFEAVAPLGKKFFVSSTMALNTDTAFLDLAARAGVKNFYCTMNVDPVSIKALQGGQRERQSLRDLVQALEDRGIRFFASCGLGRDWDDLTIADRILDLFGSTGIRTAEFFLFTPYPGSVHWDRLERQGRIMDRTWKHYNGAHVVTRPLNMMPDQLREQLIKVWREFYRRQKEQHVAHLEPATWQDNVQVVGKPLQRRGVLGQAAITGIGLFSPIGHDAATVTDALRQGRHGIMPIKRFDATPFRATLAGEVRGFEPRQWLSEAEIKKFEDPYLLLAIAAARRAVRDAGLSWDERAVKPNVALVLGTCNGGLASAEAEYAWKHGKASRPFDEMMNLESQLYGFGKALADALGIGGDAWVVSTACSATTGALGLAQRLIHLGYYDTVIVGGADVLCIANLSGFDALKVTSTGRTSPFSLPYGINLGEAACFWVVEEMEKALLRNARCLGRIAGNATTSDAYHPTTPDPRGDGVCRLLRSALADSGLSLADIGCINAHGTGTESNDKAESHGIAKFLGNTPRPVVSTKSFFGHCLGATGILEATCQLLAMNDGFIPPTLNFTEPRPGCTLDYVPNHAHDKQYRAFLSSNYAFGGNNAAVVIADRDLAVPPRPPATERVVITGLGAVTAAGLGVPRLLETLRANRVCLTPATRFPLLQCRSRLAGFVPDFKAAEVDRRIDFSVLNDISRYAVAAARLALAHGGLRVGPSNAERVGVTMGVCNGPSEMGHMDKVFGTDRYEADVNSFSNITANSTAGWVANLLCLKGENISLCTGPHAGLQALAYAFDALRENRAQAIVAMGADEVYAQSFYNYDAIEFLYAGEAERDYRLRRDEPKRKVLGEGAAALLMETASAATSRGAPVLAEVLSYGLGMDAGPFDKQNLAPNGLVRAAQTALQRAGLTPADIGLLVWSPQGNGQDQKVIEVGHLLWGDAFAALPLVTTTFTTGFIESASILVSLAATIEALRSSTELWPQRTGLTELDSRHLHQLPRHILALGSTDVGYNFAVIVCTG